MKTVWVLALVLGVVSAENSQGYYYNVPPNSYGLPSYQLGGTSSQFSSAFSSSGSNSVYKGYPGLNSDYNTGSLGSGFGSDFSSSYTGGLNSDLNSDLDSSYFLNSGSGSSGGGVRPIYHYTGSSNQGDYKSQYQSSQYQASALDKYKNYYQIQQQPTQVFKHFYVHSAPEDPEPPKPRTPIVLPPPQKHYKIIFVKTPTEKRPPQVVTVPQVQNEEKTIVYVLVKKPEESQDVIIPKVEQKPPSKPEVYFIKYKNKEDSQSVINNIVKDYNNGEPAPLVNTGVAEGSSSSDLGGASGLSNSGLSSTFDNLALTEAFGGSSLGSTYDNSGLSNGYDNSALTGNYDGSSLSSTYGNSGYGNVFGSSGYPTQVQSDSSASSFATSFGINPSPATQTLSLSSVANGANDEQFVTGVSTPATVSSTASTIGYQDGNVISTSQGIPHETYGPPKFRVD